MTVFGFPRKKKELTLVVIPVDDGDDECSDDHPIRAAAYIRLGLLALVVVSSLTGWWRDFMNNHWLAFVARIIGGFPIYASDGVKIGAV